MPANRLSNAALSQKASLLPVACRRMATSWPIVSRSTVWKTKPITYPRAAIAELFNREKDPIKLIKNKELIEFPEMATDKAEDVDVLEAESSRTPSSSQLAR